MLLQAAIALCTINCMMFMASSQAVCSVYDADVCNALAFYVISSTDIVYDIASRFGLRDYSSIVAENNITDVWHISPGRLLRIPFSCGCLSTGATLSHNFVYTVAQGEEDDTIATIKYGNLTNVASMHNVNSIDTDDIQTGSVLTIPINCSCGDASISTRYGFFGTYAAQEGDTLSSLSTRFNISQHLLQQYNPTVSFNPLEPFSSILFIPSKNSSGQYPPIKSSASAVAGGGNSGSSQRWIVVGAAVGGGVCLLALGLGIYFRTARRRCLITTQDLSSKDKRHNQADAAFDDVLKPQANFGDSDKWYSKSLLAEQCINFSFEQLAAATANFSLGNEIGRGGFATVFYGEWQGQKLAIKRMLLDATKEFFNELIILSSVHHANLVDLIGYCTENYLFLVYEYVDNGTLSHHLRSRTNPLPWKTRVQIALDAARGIEYIHDHTRQTYIHRDLKPSNILIDSNFHAKVGDFGLTKLLKPESDGVTKTGHRNGTFGYMPLEYIQFGEISVKSDIYAFGVILLQLISGRDAVLGESGHIVSVCGEVLKRPDPEEPFKSLVDPTMGNDYPVESVLKMATLAAQCTHQEAKLRPSIREVVMHLMMLSHATD